ncbi:MAG: hypothetical protein IPH75_13715 [bacterium]|nr:hypothetical protein [bacterium]
MLSRWFQITIIVMLCLTFGCGDDSPTKPVPEESFELKIAVVDSSGAPVEGLLVSTWTDTVVLNPESSSAAAPLQMDDTHLYGDVDCDGGAFTSWDTDNMMYYMARMPSTLTDEQLDCIERSGDVVPATKGITVADFEYVFLRFNYPGIPDGRTLRYGEVDYLYDESTGVISFPYPFEVWALLLTYEKPGFGWPQIVYRGHNRDIDITYGYDSSFYYALVWSNSGFEGDVVQGYGTLHSIDAAGHFGQPLRLTRVAHHFSINAWDTDLSDSVVVYRLFNEILGQPKSEYST